MKSLVMIIVCLTMVLTLPLSVQAQPPENPPPAGPINEVRQQLEQEIADRTEGDQNLQDQIDAIDSEVENLQSQLDNHPPAGQECDEGEFVTGFDQDGNIICTCLAVPGAYAIGDTGPAGGIVFYITDCGLHGLEAAPADQSDDAEWGCIGTEIAGADGTAVGTGAQNTADILAGCSESGIAAELADNYSLNSYDDWFLPSKDELDLLYQQKDVVGGFADGVYWSSTENVSSLAWVQSFSSGNQGLSSKNDSHRVRAVRAF